MRNDVTRANAVSERKNSFRKFDFFSFAVRTNVKRKRASDDKTKQHSRASPDVQFREFLLAKQKTRRTMMQFGKSIRKKLKVSCFFKARFTKIFDSIYHN